MNIMTGGAEMPHHFGHQAVVIGGSLAGLMTARVLADHFDRVTVLERDRLDERPALHQSIPQGHHLHGLLLGGQQVMASLYPGFLEQLDALGAVRCRAGTELVYYLPTGKAFSVTGTVREPRDLGFDITCHSRGLLEHCVRHCTLRHPNITFARESTVQGLMCEDGRVRGVRYHQCGEAHALATDFVVDAGGRKSQAPRWLTALGFQAPEETTIGIDLAYASTKFRVPADYDMTERLLVFIGPPPDFPNGAVMEVIEDQTWHVTLAGRFGDYPPADAAGFVAFAKSLHTPRLYDLIKDAERVADIATYRFPTSVRRHYERLMAFPEGLVVLGDAVSSFNPFYGQGMSAAALQVQALRQVLAERGAESRGLEGLARAFFPQAAGVIETPWTLTTMQDFGYPRTHGRRPPDLEASAQEFADVDALTADDPEAHRLVTEVLNLVKPFAALREEPWRSRAEAKRRRREANAAHSLATGSAAEGVTRAVEAGLSHTA
jgi:2-polyprenyl-6-methoxyphenol hydroxylase-like FAD-dependent oxidoreductase